MVIFTYFANLYKIKPLYFPACRSLHVVWQSLLRPDVMAGCAFWGLFGGLLCRPTRRYNLDDEKILRLSGKNTDGASGRVKVKNAKSPRLIQLP